MQNEKSEMVHMTRTMPRMMPIWTQDQGVLVARPSQELVEDVEESVAESVVVIGIRSESSVSAYHIRMYSIIALCLLPSISPTNLRIMPIAQISRLTR